MTALRARPDDRRTIILDAARDLFVENGYAATSTDAIVAASGGSKQTFYALFGNKAGLFRAVVERAAASLGTAIESQALDPDEPATVLRRVGIDCLGTWIAPRSLELIRLVIAESPRIPEIAEILIRFGTKAPEDALVAFFERAHARGTLDAPEPQVLARAFVALVVRPVLPSLMRMRPLPPEKIAAHVDAILPLFLRLCTPPERSHAPVPEAIT
jgi:AcrR family transcriptional regulator